ncbi:SDR family NAD(P)-dependent oxidoreductase [Salinibacterium sp.]|uniref:SDR family NAD(P)-dependent oxidoreductase n=1 Tax=Salinibacterium sp. TaxID=1915057 RepID=UPI002869F447|nr:SDR family NAD(P)-dependent oxidoreductase [Salinibacterium sp.]
MTTSLQSKLPSGFGAQTTAADVLVGIDLQGRTAIVTGGYSGLGIETVAALSGAGATVIVPARRPDVARAALDVRGLGGSEAVGQVEVGRVEVDELDLADLGSVRAFSGRFLASGRSLDILINNAGIMAAPESRVGEGWESQFATNHLGHYVLTNLLWPALIAADDARVVSLSSTGHKLSGIRFDDPQFTTGYDKWLAYGQAKTANSLFAVQLDALGAPHGVHAFAVHPGGIMTELQRHLPREEMIASGWISEDGTLNARFKTPEQGAATSVWAATSPQLAGVGGVYCEDCDIAEPTVPGAPNARVAGVNEHAIDPDAASWLWNYSAQLTGVNVFA